jgi:hypothetical protein
VVTAETAVQTEQGARWLIDEEAHAAFDAGDFMDVHDDRENIEFTELGMLIPWGR